MALFDFAKKKTDGFKPLSENEIQSRLYGTFRPPHLDEKKLKETSKDSVSKNKVEAPAVIKSTSTDLFTSTTKSAPITAPIESSEPKKSEGREEVQRWLSREKDTVEKTVAAKPNINQTFKPRSTTTPGATSGSAWFQTASKSAFAVLGLMISVCLSIVRGIQNLRLPWKKWLPWIGGLVLIVGLVFSIQGLNAQRETAMSRARKVLPAKVQVTEAGETAVVQATGKSDRKKSGENNQDPISGVSNADSETGNQSLSNASVQGKSEISDETRAYVIQVATYVNSADAEKMLGVIKNANFTGFIQSLKRQSGRVYHCIFLGRYKTSDEADQALARFKRQSFSATFPDAFVRKLK